MPEPLPVNTILTDLDAQWNASNVVEPFFIEVTGNNEPIRFDLNRGDHVIGRAGSPAFEEEPIGNWKYGNRTYSIELELYTRSGRQRLYDLMAEIRRLCHNRRHALTNFQRQQFMGFEEETQEHANVWMGTVEIELVNNAVLLET
tara:strand:- start:433 stop:867 length:435 start_codon:yes stop_codon:yes gene_type:complete